MAKRHEALYRRFKADESAQTITGPYRQLHPHDNNERQAIHEHASGLPAATATRRRNPRLAPAAGAPAPAQRRFRAASRAARRPGGGR